jgi:predicted ATPase
VSWSRLGSSRSTLTGAGGSGKTRLALEVARSLVRAYPEGVWFVELAPLSEEELLPQAVAEVLEVPERPQEPLTDTLVEVLREREILLVLDNCEHLMEAVAQLVDALLDSCPRLRILATSRESLGVEGELRWPVPPLGTPDPRCTPTMEELERSESARLFVARARNRDPYFAFTPAVAQSVAEVCSKLEGIPLAIELAAARVNTLSLEQISERLAHSLELLTRGGRTVSPRQRTLKSALDWSHELLSEPEKTLFWRLSVFAGGWTLEAAEAVASGGGVEGDVVLDLVAELVEKSLVAAEPTERGQVRYRLLEPVRQYALEKVQESGESEVIERAHAQYFLAISEEAEPQLIGPREAEWFERLEEELDNIRAALSWTRAQEDTELSLRLAGALMWFWSWAGLYGEGAGG